MPECWALGRTLGSLTLDGDVHTVLFGAEAALLRTLQGCFTVEGHSAA